MKNWSTDENLIKKDREKYTIWKIEQMVNFGLDGQRLSVAELKKYWHQLHLDPDKKKYLQRIIYE